MISNPTLRDGSGFLPKSGHHQASELIGSDTKIGFQLSTGQISIIMSLIFSASLWYIRSESQAMINNMMDHQRIMNESINIRTDALIKSQDYTISEIKEMRNDIKKILAGQRYQ